MSEQQLAPAGWAPDVELSSTFAEDKAAAGHPSDTPVEELTDAATA